MNGTKEHSRKGKRADCQQLLGEAGVDLEVAGSKVGSDPKLSNAAPQSF